MHQRTVHVIRYERAACASRFPVRPQHEVIHDQLAASVEELSERLWTIRRFERIALLDFHPRQRAAFFGERIACMCQRLLLGQVRLLRGKPFLLRNYQMLFHLAFSSSDQANSRTSPSRISFQPDSWLSRAVSSKNCSC